MKVKFLANVTIDGQRYLAGHEAEINFNTAEHLKARGLVDFEQPKAQPKVTTQKASTKKAAK